jgi:riboflavin biosynthesis pyrimidine reductase
VDKKRRAANKLKPNDDSIGKSAEKVRNDNPELKQNRVGKDESKDMLFLILLR